MPTRAAAAACLPMCCCQRTGLSEAALHDADAPPRSPTAAAAAAAAAPPQLAPLTRQQLTLIRGAGERLLRLVNNVLDATALQHDSLLLSKQRVALAPLVKEVADLTRPLVRVRWLCASHAVQACLRACMPHTASNSTCTADPAAAVLLLPPAAPAHDARAAAQGRGAADARARGCGSAW